MGMGSRGMYTWMAYIHECFGTYVGCTSSPSIHSAEVMKRSGSGMSSSFGRPLCFYTWDHMSRKEEQV